MDHLGFLSQQIHGIRCFYVNRFKVDLKGFKLNSLVNYFRHRSMKYGLTRSNQISDQKTSQIAQVL